MSFSLPLSDCVAPLQAGLNGSSVEFTGVSIDTRTLSPGDLYVAIQGERFNGHEFVAQAEQAGARAVLVHEPVVSNLPQLTVTNTQTALGQLAQLWTQRFDIPIIAITGSNGKTTVKEIIATILRQLGPVLATRGNLNNELGVPLTLLEMRQDHLYAVIEMGASHAGEIARLVQIAKPDVAVVTNIGTAHLEGFGSVAGIAQAKSEIYAGLTSEGFAIINADDQYADQMRTAAAHCHRFEFGTGAESGVQGVPGAGLNFKLQGATLSPRFQLNGDHNGLNALAAVAAVHCLDIQSTSIVRGIESVRSVPGRLEKKPGVNGATVIDDSYNANPDSVKQAINVLSRCGGVRYLVLGDMAELGAEADSLHAKLGSYAKQTGVDGLWTTGPLASHAYNAFSIDRASASAGGHFVDQETLINDLKASMKDGVTVLVKGSRSARMERVVKALMPVAKASMASSSVLPS